jgi:Flp pilus assembly protein TadD
MNDVPSESIQQERPDPPGIAIAPRWKVTAVCALLAGLVFGVFGQAIAFPFVNLDDLAYVPEHPVVSRGLSLAGIGWAFTHFHCGLWHPATVISLMLDRQMFGSWAGGFHLVNLLLHAACAVLLFLMLLEMTGAFWRSGFVAAVFAIHPLRAESVIWITERKDVLSGLFFMLMLLAYVRYARGPRSKGRYTMVLLWLALGLMSKAMLVTAPGVLLLLDYWPLGRLKNLSDLPALMWEKAPLFALCILSSVAAFFALSTGDHLPVQMYPAGAPVAYLIYLGKLIYPSHLALPYPLPRGGWPCWQVLGALLLLTALTGGAWLLRRKQPWLLTGWLWYLGMLLPIIRSMQTDYPQACADRFTYLPQIGLCFAGTWLAADWAARRRHSGAILGSAAAVILIALSVAGWRQSTYWRDSVTLFTHSLECNRDNYYAHYVLGDALYREGKFAEAGAEFRESLRIDPAHKEAHLALGAFLSQQGRIDEAVTQFREALSFYPASAAMQYYLGKALLHQGSIEEASEHLHTAARNDPNFAGGLTELGTALLERGRADEGIAAYRDALRINPDNAVARTNLGNAFFKQGKPEEAIAQLQRALELQPADTTIQNDLAWMLATAPKVSLRNGTRALELARKSIQAPGGPNAYSTRTLAAAYAENGDYSHALQTAQTALQLAVAQTNPALANTLRRDIKLYEAGSRIAATH